MINQDWKKQLEDELKTTNEEIKFLEKSEDYRETAEEITNELDEDFTESEDEIVGNQQLADWIQRKHQIVNALEKIESGKNFGNCENCGLEINARRLKLMPYTPYCVSCQTKLEKQVS